MPAGDLLAVLVDPARTQLETLLAPRLPGPVVGGLRDLVDVVAIVGLGGSLAAAGRVLGRAPEAEPPGASGRMTGALRVLSLAVAAALLAWIGAHPGAAFHELFIRGDHLAFAALTGWTLVRAPLRWRPWLVSALSVAVLSQYSGPLALGVALAAGLTGFAAATSPVGRRAWAVVLVHATIGLVVYTFCWRMRTGSFFQALHVYGLFAFLFLRQISFAVAAYHGGGGSIGGYLCYLVFYPGVTGIFGGPEVWSEFSRRNLSGPARPDYARAPRSVVRGMAQLWVADRIPISADVVIASPTLLLTWTTSLVFFVQVALRGMGYWAMIDATASFYGFRLRPNFEGILRARNPSELWRSWRGALTNWLVCHVYAPLGANRRHQSLNILAAFGASLVWHWAGVPFLRPGFELVHLLPITLWAVANALAVVGHAQMTRRHLSLLPEATPAPVRLGIHRFLTWCLGTLGVTLPSFQLGAHEQLGPFLRRLVGLGD
jgi:hypothetical protein